MLDLHKKIIDALTGNRNGLYPKGLRVSSDKLNSKSLFKDFDSHRENFNQNLA